LELFYVTKIVTTLQVATILGATVTMILENSGQVGDPGKLVLKETKMVIS